MKIAVVSKASAKGGGASRIAENLTAGLLDHDHQATHFVAQENTVSRDFQVSFKGRALGDRITNRAHLQCKRWGLGQVFPGEYLFNFWKIARDFDLLHFHDHKDAFAWTSVGLISREVPVVVTGHDCMHLTGGCLYPIGCQRFEENCGSCPQRASLGHYDFTSLHLHLNRWVARQPNVQYIYPSRWLSEVAKRSLSFAVEPMVIPNGFPHESYNFPERSVAREELGIANDRNVVIIPAGHLSDSRKGICYALEAIASVKDMAPLVILIGKPTDGIEEALDGVNYWFSGYIESRRRLGTLFAAADACLFCSIQDNLPITVQEAMGAATPVVGFASGGVPEMVEHGKTGWLVPTGDQIQLNEALTNALQNVNDRCSRGELSRQRLSQLFSQDSFLDHHIRLYQSLTA